MKPLGSARSHMKSNSQAIQPIQAPSHPSQVYQKTVAKGTIGQQQKRQRSLKKRRSTQEQLRQKYGKKGI